MRACRRKTPRLALVAGQHVEPTEGSDGTDGRWRIARKVAPDRVISTVDTTRSAIERIIAWTATQNGRRVRLRYLGAAKTNAWLHTRCAAINLRTLLRHGLTRHDGAWILA
jgi:IS5 family transposase